MDNKDHTICGVIPVMKEQGYTSNDVVAKLRGILRMKKVGHTGTLDPAATGVLPVCLGKATRIAGYLTDTDKTYTCVMRLGLTSDTEDMTGDVSVVSDCKDMDPLKVEEAMLSFLGEYDQIPPMYSAKKVNGRKLYELAREGIEIDRKPSRVIIKSISDIEFPDSKPDIRRVRFGVECSKGTYIRSLCRDIGEKLGCGAVMESLVRTKACGIEIKDCYTLGEIEDTVRNGRDIMTRIIPVDHFYKDCGELKVSSRIEKFVRNGNRFRITGMPSGRYRVYLEDGTFAAVYDIDSDEARLCRLFL